MASSAVALVPWEPSCLNPLAAVAARPQPQLSRQASSHVATVVGVEVLHKAARFELLPTARAGDVCPAVDCSHYPGGGGPATGGEGGLSRGGGLGWDSSSIAGGSGPVRCGSSLPRGGLRSIRVWLLSGGPVNGVGAGGRGRVITGVRWGWGWGARRPSCVRPVGWCGPCPLLLLGG